MVGGAGIAVVVLLLLGMLDGMFPFLAQVQPRTFVRKELLVALGSLVAASGLIYALAVRKGTGTVWALAACALLFADLYVFGAGHNTAPMNPEDHFRRSERLVNFFKSQEGIFRVNSRNSQGMIMDRNQGNGGSHLHTGRIHSPLPAEDNAPRIDTGKGFRPPEHPLLHGYG
jgi:hypothetical protein